MPPRIACLNCGVPSNNGSRCNTCQDVWESSKPKRERLSSSSRGYDSEWNQVRLFVLRRDKYICTYCQKVLSGADATVDHIIPLAKGGDRLALGNLVACCRSCNSSKKDRIA